MRYLGIDYGSKKVGLALSDEAGTMGFPYGIIPNTPHLFEDLRKIIEREKIGAVVIGDGLNLDGSKNTITAGVVGLAVELDQSGIPVAIEREIYTSAEARRQLEREPKSRSPKTKKNIDDSAAALILTSYLSHVPHDEKPHQFRGFLKD
ncbi:Holliday junction resolvase RuvX [Candidatus Kaiserbacteria bacterium]|nr:Holliday junction resolvase RuvX [Candidatus Kaiserbacteria bacterium]